jgi:hypothetical protein
MTESKRGIASFEAEQYSSGCVDLVGTDHEMSSDGPSIVK